MSSHLWPLACGVLITLAFTALAAYIVRATPERHRARVLSAAAALMAPLPAILITLLGR